MAEDKRDGNKEHIQPNTYFEIKVPREIVPKSAIITMVTPRKTDAVIFIDPSGEHNNNPKKSLIKGRTIAARLENQRHGDCVAYNVTGIRKNQVQTHSVLRVFRFTSSNGWTALEGNIALHVKD